MVIKDSIISIAFSRNTSFIARSIYVLPNSFSNLSDLKKNIKKMEEDKNIDPAQKMRNTPTEDEIRC